MSALRHERLPYRLHLHQEGRDFVDHFTLPSGPAPTLRAKATKLAELWLARTIQYDASLTIVPVLTRADHDVRVAATVRVVRRGVHPLDPTPRREAVDWWLDGAPVAAGWRVRKLAGALVRAVRFRWEDRL